MEENPEEDKPYPVGGIFIKRDVEEETGVNCQVKRRRTNSLYLIRLGNGIEAFACGLCGYRNTSKSATVAHLSQHNEDSYLCAICDCLCADSARFAEHMKGHVGKRVFTCAHCSFSSIWYSALDEHVLDQHKKLTSVAYICDHCGYKANSKGNLSLHMIDYHL